MNLGVMFLFVFAKIACKRNGHIFRRAHTNEDQALKFCRRCGHSVAVKKRKPREQK